MMTDQTTTGTTTTLMDKKRIEHQQEKDGNDVTTTSLSMTSEGSSSSSSSSLLLLSPLESITCKDIFLSSQERYEVWEVKSAERPHLLLDEQSINTTTTTTTTFNPTNSHHPVEQEQQQQEEIKEKDNIKLNKTKHEEEEDQQNVHDNDEDDDDDDAASHVSSSTTTTTNDVDELPLIDGCDIPNWRHYGLVTISPYLQGILNIGVGCPMTRRLSQLPMLSTRCQKTWQELQQKLLQPPLPTSTPQKLSSEETFQLEYYPWFERENIPVILEGCCSTWKAMTNCQWSTLLTRFGTYDWRFSDTHGITMTLSTYHKYISSIEGQSDDAPLAVYDSQLHTDNRRIIFEEDYKVPKCFSAPDLFECLDNDNDSSRNTSNKDNDEDNEDDDNEDNNDGSPCRPPYRWILMGPARSGTGLHIDPLGTHAWVSLIEGLKRWVLFPYGTDPISIGMPPTTTTTNDDSPAAVTINSVIWFRDYYESCIQQHPGAVEVLQYPGETVYVPAGWPHIVLNLKASVAITQNYATEYPTFQRVVSAVTKEEPDMVQPWLHQLKVQRPDLF